MLGAVAARSWATVPRPKLTVLIITEELRADALEAAWPQLRAGGFRRLAEKGAWFPDCRHLSSTFSACGIANLATGAWPAQHGIVADSWWDYTAHAEVRASQEELLATTLAAQAAGDAGMRVYVVGMTPEQAALFAGTSTARLYYWDERGQYTTPGPAPDWLREFNIAKGPEGARDANWMILNAAADAQPLRTLHYDTNHPQQFLGLYRASPFGQTEVFEMAGELLVRERLGQETGSDLLCVLDGSAAALGYDTGARSPLMEQMVLQLDRRLENLLNQLAHALGEYGFNLAVCAAHGAPPAPSTEARARLAVDGVALAQAIDNGLKDADKRVEKYLYPFLYLDRKGGTPESVRRLAGDAAMAYPAVAGYYTADGICSVNDDWKKRFQNSFHPKRSGDVMLSYRPLYVEDFFQGRGISYGSLYNYDACVPLFFYGPQFRAGVFEAPVDAVDVAPTLARAMGVAAPSSSVGRVLAEALAQ